MLWESSEMVRLDSGRRVRVPKGVIGLDISGDTLYVGGRPMTAIGNNGPADLLTSDEKLDVIRYHVRQCRTFEDRVIGEGRNG